VVGANFTGSTTFDESNKPPTVSVEGPDHRTAKVGQPFALIAIARDDDGNPKRRRRHKAVRLDFARRWGFAYPGLNIAAQRQ
jgi:hypothetical protein